jgi:Ion channel
MKARHGAVFPVQSAPGEEPALAADDEDDMAIPWGLTFRFLKQLALGLWYFSPLLAVLAATVLLLGYLGGKTEGWSPSDSFYWAFVTATTVGYGDFRPTRRRSRIIAILIAMLGLLMTGIIIALGVNAATKAMN